jgi:hypothetical protein
MVREKGAEPPPYPAEKARGGEIVLRRAWERILFVPANAWRFSPLTT